MLPPNGPFCRASSSLATAAILLSVCTTGGLAQQAGLVAAYSFNEGSGSTVSDASGAGNNGSTSQTSWTGNGKYGGALVFNGSGSLVTVNDSPSLQLTSGVTLEAWVKPTQVSDKWRDVVYKGPDSIYLEATSPSGSRPAAGVRVGSSGDYVETYGAAPLPTNTWSHLALSYDGSTLKLYVNGNEIDSQSAGGNLFSSNGNPLEIGGDAAYGAYFAGTIDEVRVYNRALTQQQIQADMTLPISQPGTADGPCDLTQDGTVDEQDVAAAVDMALGLRPCTTDIGDGGVCDVVVVQRVVNAVLEGQCGGGVEPIPHSVRLSWLSSSSPDVVGHNAYRSSSVSGPFTKVNQGLISGLTFTDSTVESGQTYYYGVTAVNGDNLESSMSNVSPAVIPFP